MLCTLCERVTVLPPLSKTWLRLDSIATMTRSLNLVLKLKLHTGSSDRAGKSLPPGNSSIQCLKVAGQALFLPQNNDYWVWGVAGHQNSAQKWFLLPTVDFPLRAIFRRIRQQLIDCRQEAKSNSNCGNLPRKSKQFGSSGARGSLHAPFQESLLAIGERAAQHTHTQILKIPLSLVVGCFLSELRLLPKVTQGVGHLGCGCSASHTERAYRQTFRSSAPSSYGAKALPGNGIIFGRLESLQRTEG